MNNDQRILAFISLGLCVATLLVPFFIAAMGRGDLALGFAVVAGLLAMLFGAFSWKEYIGRTVAIVLPIAFVAGLVVVLVIRAESNNEAELAKPAEILPLQPPPGVGK
jgi:hypothetical protein